MALRLILLVALLTSILFVGCSNPQKQIVGTWEFTGLDFGDDLANDPVTRGLLSSGTDVYKGSTMTFNEDGTYSGAAEGIVTTGAYTLTERRIQLTTEGWGDMGRFSGILADDGKTLFVDFPNLPGTKMVYVKQ